MPHSYRLLVKNNIDSFGKKIDVVSQIFYRELFYLDISLKTVFHGDVVFLNRKFSNMLATFKNVKHLEKITASVEKMGERHVMQYQSQLEHFPTVENALMIALKEYLGDGFTEELEQAWHQVFKEVADIMTDAMKKVAPADILVTEKQVDKQMVNLLTQIGSEQYVLNVHQRFYDVMFDEPWLEKFFFGKSKEALILKQTQFMIAAFSGPNNYTGDTPAFVHMHMFITDEMIEVRERILRACIVAEGLSEEIADKWLKIDHSFKAAIVKKSAEECVLKCLGQMPITVEKPLGYIPKF